MIHVIRGPSANNAGKFDFAIPSLRLCGKSRQPLLDACRMVKRMGGDTSEQIGLFRIGSRVPDIVTTVGKGSELTVSDPASGSEFGFVKYKEFGWVQ